MKKRLERENMEKRKKEEEIREAKRQQKKLNFLLTQTELFSHFIAKKEEHKMLEETAAAPKGPEETEVDIMNVDEEEDLNEKEREEVKKMSEIAVEKQRQYLKDFDNELKDKKAQAQLPATLRPSKAAATPAPPSAAAPPSPPQIPTPEEPTIPQPKMFKGNLKTYQLKGLSWLVNLYDQVRNLHFLDSSITVVCFFSTSSSKGNQWNLGR
jgi:DNA helicase INO80